VGLIDVGYFKAASASALNATPRQLTPKPEAWVEWLKDLGPTIPGGPLFLRLYWYDGAYDAVHSHYEAQRAYFDNIATVPGIQLRLGHLQVKKAPKWQYPIKAALKKMGALEEFEEHFKFRPELTQKGVDTLMTLDLVRLAQRAVYDAAVLVTGDRDLAEPVRAAQDEGRRVLLVRPEGGGLAPELGQLADEVRTLAAAELSPLFDVNKPESES
jgi:uncharacterized LabA/DUF88 family protein